MHVPGQRGRAAITADLGSRHSVGLVVGAKAAIFLRDGNAQEACAMQIPVIVRWEFRFAIIRCGASGKYVLAKRARGCDDRSRLVR